MTTNPHHGLPPVLAGPPPAEARGVMVLLHGRGRDAAEMLGLAEKLALPDMACVAIPAAGGTWYPQSFLAPLEKNQPALEHALERVESVVRGLEEQGIARSRVALVGFSQGACLACEYLSRSPGRWGALVAWTGGLIGPPGTTWGAAQDLMGTPVLLAICDEDAWVPLGRVKETANVFRARGASVELRVHRGTEHVVTDDQIDAARALLAPLAGGSK